MIEGDGGARELSVHVRTELSLLLELKLAGCLWRAETMTTPFREQRPAAARARRDSRKQEWPVLGGADGWCCLSYLKWALPGS
ncbi:hypothetical protein Ct61P_07812 [Colletotrichum tofieldiae]|nr:hypothetical protein Ct61P_07812 [Colletotrichum tofieldiae]